MTKFKSGEKIEAISDSVHFRKGMRGIVLIDGELDEESNLLNLLVEFDDGSGNFWVCEKYFKLVEEKKEELKLTQIKTMTQKLKGLMSRIFDADLKAQYEAGYINGDLELTDKCKNELMMLLYMEKKAEITKLAKAELEEARKEK